ncbi:MAG: hydrolase [Odoribacter sp.]|nr:hydrolase [Odoribacter sp.]
MKIALVSLDQVWEDKKANQLKCQDYIEQASKFNCVLIIFPEMTLTGFSMNTKLIKENPNQSPTIEFFSQQARQNKLSIAFGVVFEKEEKANNNLIIIDHKGKVLSGYAKIHPFSFSGENNYYFGGDELVTCQIADATIGLTICYDLRFPEIFQALSKNSNIILTIANWPERRIKHWNALLEARAIENQLFIIGVNRIGTDGNDYKYIKSSCVFYPTGEKMEPIHSNNDMDIYDLNLDDVISARESFPLKQDRKTEFYKSIL